MSVIKAFLSNLYFQNTFECVFNTPVIAVGQCNSCSEILSNCHGHTSQDVVCCMPAFLNSDGSSAELPFYCCLLTTKVNFQFDLIAELW